MGKKRVKALKWSRKGFCLGGNKIDLVKGKPFRKRMGWFLVMLTVFGMLMVSEKSAADMLPSEQSLVKSLLGVKEQASADVPKPNTCGERSPEESQDSVADVPVETPTEGLPVAPQESKADGTDTAESAGVTASSEPTVDSTVEEASESTSASTTETTASSSSSTAAESQVAAAAVPKKKEVPAKEGKTSNSSFDPSKFDLNNSATKKTISPNKAEGEVSLEESSPQPIRADEEAAIEASLKVGTLHHHVKATTTSGITTSVTTEKRAPSTGEKRSNVLSIIGLVGVVGVIVLTVNRQRKGKW